jgi:uncharacterized protein (DUF2147 family)
MGSNKKLLLLYKKLKKLKCFEVNIFFREVKIREQEGMGLPNGAYTLISFGGNAGVTGGGIRVAIRIFFNQRLKLL